MTKLNLLILQLAVILTFVSPSYSADNRFGQKDEYFINEAFVPNSSGKLQGRQDFKLLFSGQQDLATVRLITRVPLNQYSFLETIKHLLFDKDVLALSLTGTATKYGILTNGHGFVQEAPAVENTILKYLGFQGRFYRTLHLVRAEQGLTLRNFQTQNPGVYHDPRRLFSSSISVSSLISVPIIYRQPQTESVLVMRGYIHRRFSWRHGWFYGSLNHDYDVAVIKT